MGHYTRLAPPAGSSPHLTTKLVGGTADVRLLLAQGWTIVEANGEAIVDTPHNGASVDVPPNISERIEQVLGEAPKKRGPQPGTKYRPRIVRPATAILALFLSLQSMAQPPLTRYSFNDSTVYALVRPTIYAIRECGREVAEVVVRTKEGFYYKVVILKDTLEGLKPGSPVPIKREHLP